MYEIIRLIDSVMLYEYYQVATAGDWKYGDDVIVSNDLSNDKLLQMYPQGVTTINSYWKTTPSPDK